MRILHLLDHSLPIHDGYSLRSHNILRCQADVGFEVAAVTSPKHEADWKGSWAPDEVIGGIRYLRTGAVAGSRVPFAGEWRLMGALERRIAEAARELRPHLLHAHSPILNAIPAARVARRLGIPLVYEIRAFWEDAAADQGTYGEGSAKYRLVRRLESWCCRQADRVVTICDGLREDLLARGLPGARVEVVPNAVRPDEFTAARPDQGLRAQWGLEGKTVVGFVGSFYHFEGLDLLVRAAARLAPEFPNLALLLVGGGETEDRLRGEVRSLGLEGRVVFGGRVPHGQVPGVYGLIDVLAYPRKPMRLTELVTPLKPLEAMAMGKALVASDVGGHRELVRDGETGLLHRAGSDADLALALARLLTRPTERERLGHQGRDWVRSERTWNQNAERYRSLYASLAGTER